jgi:hypothetical protein
VRVLNPRAGTSVNQGGRFGTDAERSRLPRTSNVIPNAPIVQRGQPVEQPRQGALPSARFAHPRDRDQVGERSSMPRPGVSYISGAEQDNRQRTPRSTLPQVPQIQRAESAGRPAPIREEQLPRPTVSQPRAATPETDRFRRTESNPPAYARDEGRPQPVRREPPPQPMQQPRYQPLREQPRVEQPRYEAPRYVQEQRAAPPPVRAEAARPQRGEAHEERKPQPRPRDDGHR